MTEGPCSPHQAHPRPIPGSGGVALTLALAL